MTLSVGNIAASTQAYSSASKKSQSMQSSSSSKPLSSSSNITVTNPASFIADINDTKFSVNQAKEFLNDIRTEYTDLAKNIKQTQEADAKVQKEVVNNTLQENNNKIKSEFEKRYFKSLISKLTASPEQYQIPENTVDILDLAVSPNLDLNTDKGRSDAIAELQSKISAIDKNDQELNNLNTTLSQNEEEFFNIFEFDDKFRDFIEDEDVNKALKETQENMAKESQKYVVEYNNEYIARVLLPMFLGYEDNSEIA